MHACALRWAALLLLVDAMPGPAEGPGFVNTTSLNAWHHAQQSPICSRNTSLSKAIGVIPPLINTVYYTGRSDSDLKHLTAAHGGATWPAASTDIRWPSHYRFLYYDDDDMMKSMAQLDPLLEAEGVSGTLKAFQDLRPGAFKADIWRYAILWACGGIYVDGKMRLAQDWDAFLRKEMTLGKYTFDDGGDHLISCIDRWVTRLDRNQTIKGVWQGLLVSTPRHPDLLRVLRHVVDNVVHRRYFPDEGKLEMLYVTGPAAFARATQTAGSGWKGRIHLPCHMGNHGPQLRTIWGSGSVLFVQDAQLHEGLRGGPEQSYPELYKKHLTYMDDG